MDWNDRNWNENSEKDLKVCESCFFTLKYLFDYKGSHICRKCLEAIKQNETGIKRSE